MRSSGEVVDGDGALRMIMDGEAMSSAYLSLALTAVDAEIADTTASGSGRLTEAIIAVAQNMSVAG